MTGADEPGSAQPPSGQVPAIDAATAPPVAYVVTGTVSSPVSTAVGGLDLALVDKNVGRDVVLVTGATDALGQFSLTAELSPASLAARHKTSPDLQVQVLQAGAISASSIVRYNATTVEELDVVLPATAALPSEYETPPASATRSARPMSPAPVPEGGGMPWAPVPTGRRLMISTSRSGGRCR